MFPCEPRGRQLRPWSILGLALVVMLSHLAISPGQQPSTSTALPNKPTEPDWLKRLTRLTADQPVWFDPQKHFVVVAGEVVLREGALEMFACLKNTKEHESVVAVSSPAFVVHTALLAVGARAGSPARFYPEYRAVTGTSVSIELVWIDSEGKEHRENARRCVRDFRTGKPLDHDWVFGGSSFWTDPNTGEKFYNAEGGDLICVANFPTAMLDLPVHSSQLNAERLFEAFTKNIPPLGTRVFLVLTPQREPTERSAPTRPGDSDSGNSHDDKKDPATALPAWRNSEDHSTQGAGSSSLQVQPGSTTAHDFTYTDPDGRTERLPYLLSVPMDDARQGSPIPLILFLHGLGECGLGGDQLDRVRSHGPWREKLALDHFPFAVLAPQCPPPKPEDPVESYREKWQVEPLLALLDHVEAGLSVDTSRVYIMGLSMGGYGTWRLAAAHPERFAAAVPICGGGDPQWAPALARLPIWAFHGERDSVVPVSRTREMVTAILQANGSPRMTIYPDADHDSWTRTFANPEVYEWLLSHRVQPAE